MKSKTVIRALPFLAFAVAEAMALSFFFSLPKHGRDYAEPTAALALAAAAPTDYILPIEYLTDILHYCDETGVPVWLACRLFYAESRWQWWAVGAAGEQGLAQLMPNLLSVFADAYNDGRRVNPFDPGTSIRVGLRYLAHLKAELGEWQAAVAAYNCGLGRYRTGRIPQSTVNYVNAIFNRK